MATSPVFTEVIDVSFDLASFQQSLDKMVNLVKEAYSQMSGMGIDGNAVLGTSAVAGFNEEIGQLRSALEMLGQDFLSNFTKVQTAVVETAGKSAQSAKAAIEETDAAQTKSIKAQLEGLAQFARSSEQAWEIYKQAAKTALDAGLNPKSLTPGAQASTFSAIREQMPTDADKEAMFRGFTPDTKQWFADYAQYLSKIEASTAEAADQITAEWESAQRKQVGVYEQAQAQMESALGKRTALEIESLARSANANEENAAKFRSLTTSFVGDGLNPKSLSQSAQFQVFNELQKWMETSGALGQETFSKLTGAQQEWFVNYAQGIADMENKTRDFFAEQERLAVEAAEAAEAADQKWMQDRGQLIARAQAEMERALKPKEEDGGLFGGTLGMAQTLIEFQLMMKAIQGVTDLIKAPYEIIKGGIEYLNQTQIKADEIRGVIQDNVKFSGDWEAQLQKVDIAAGAVMRKLQDVAIADHLKLPDLTNSFKTLSNAGGANFVKDMNDMVRLAELFNLAMKASGTSTETTRKLVSEIPKALEGTEAPSSRLLLVLHMSAEEFKKMREQALEQKDLVAQLEERLQPYLQSLGRVQEHHEQIVERLELMKNRWEGLAAAPVMDVLDKAMSGFADWCDKNKDKVNDLAGAIGDAATALVKFLSIPLPGVHSDDGHSLVASAASKIGGAIDNTLAFFDGHKTFDQQEAEQKAAAQAALKKAQNTVNGVNFDTTSVMSEPFTATHKPGDLDADKNGADRLRELHEKFSGEIDGIKNDTQKAIQGVDDLLAKSAIASQDAADQKIAALEAEKQRVNDLIAKYKELASHTGAKGTQVAQFKTRLDNTATQTTGDGGSIDTAEGKAQEAADKDAFERKQQYIRDTLKAYTDLHNAQISLAKASGANEAEVARDIAAINEETYNKNVQLLQNDLDANTADTTKRAHLEQELADMKAVHAVQQQLDSKKVADAEIADAMRSIKEQEAIGMAGVHQHEAAVAQMQENGANGGKLRAENQALAQEYLRVVDAALTEVRALLLASEAKNGETEATRKLRVELAQLTAERQKAQNSVNTANRNSHQLTPIGPATSGGNQKAQIDADTKAVTAAAEKVAEDLAQVLKATMSGDADAIKEHTAALQEDTDSLNAAVAQKQSDQSQQQGAAIDKIFGPGFKDDWDSASTGMQKFEVGLDGAANALKTLPGMLGGVISDFKSGNVLGGIGGAMGAAGGIVSMIPGGQLAGGIMSAVGSIVQSISGLFTSAAKHIAEQIDNEISVINAAYSTGDANLITTLNSLKDERNKAISQLSGQKGGQDELMKILGQLDPEINQLWAQVKQIQETFDQGFNVAQVLSKHSQSLADFLSKWQQLNKQVADYIGAGGSIQTATQMLQDSLQQMKEDATDQLRQGYEGAINDALQLNDLIQQRTVLEKQWAQQVFDAANGDALERRGSAAIDHMQDYSYQKQQYQEQLENLNSQISLTQQKVDAEGKIFDIAKSYSGLLEQSNEQQLLDLQEQIQKWKDIKAIADGITYQNGKYGINPGSSLNLGTGAINIVLGGDIATEDGKVIAKEIADALTQALQTLARYGNGNTLQGQGNY